MGSSLQMSSAHDMSWDGIGGKFPEVGAGNVV